VSNGWLSGLWESFLARHADHTSAGACSAPDSNRPLRALDESLKAIVDAFGKLTAAWVALQMQELFDRAVHSRSRE